MMYLTVTTRMARNFGTAKKKARNCVMLKMARNTQLSAVRNHTLSVQKSIVFILLRDGQDFSLQLTAVGEVNSKEKLGYKIPKSYLLYSS